LVLVAGLLGKLIRFPYEAPLDGRHNPMETNMTKEIEQLLALIEKCVSENGT